MDEVLEKLGNTLISTETKDESKTNFEDLYKNWGKLGNQEERRREILEVQKGNRNNNLDTFRGILNLVKDLEDNDIFRSEKVYYKPNIYVAGFNTEPTSYRNVLMNSEWMIEKPQDFHENWCVVPCPKGVRMLVVANQGITRCYTKYGQFRYVKKTALPGGNPIGGYMKNKCCVLDCFYVEQTNTMWILDLLAWNCQPMTDGEAEFRHYWLESQLAELPDLKVLKKNNQILFNLLPMVSCSPDSFNKFMMTYPMFTENATTLDGLLFYHKRAHYVSGQTPLVGWLYPYMVPEVIGNDVTVSQVYLLAKPESYKDQASFIKEFDAKYAKKSRNRYMSTNEMDTTNSYIGKKSRNRLNSTNKMDTADKNDENNTNDNNKIGKKETKNSKNELPPKWNTCDKS